MHNPSPGSFPVPASVRSLSEDPYFDSIRKCDSCGNIRVTSRANPGYCCFDCWWVQSRARQQAQYDEEVGQEVNGA